MSDEPDLSAEVANLYLALMAALDGATPQAARSSLAMAVLMTGEKAGLDGLALLDWIDQARDQAKAALGLPAVPRH